jgi:predicted SAM-dependent methyltransferase
MMKDGKKMIINVNIGCGKTPTDGWLNFDNSPALKLANSPIWYRIAKVLGFLSSAQIENIEWNKKNSITFADATKTLPLKDSSVDTIYTSHMVEHLSQDRAIIFLKESMRVLKVGGVLRIAVPDLKIAVEKYLESKDADAFMRGILVQAPPMRSLKQKISLLVSGYRHHQWMYDGASLTKLLIEMKYKNVEVCRQGYTNISDTDGLNLHERAEQSVFVEGIK